MPFFETFAAATLGAGVVALLQALARRWTGRSSDTANAFLTTTGSTRLYCASESDDGQYATL